jgi:hypothetical protein
MLPAQITPAYMTLPVAAWHFGTSRSTLYRRAREGHIVLKKHRGRTVLVVASAVEFFESLPDVKLGKRSHG